VVCLDVSRVLFLEATHGVFLHAYVVLPQLQATQVIFKPFCCLYVAHAASCVCSLALIDAPPDIILPVAV